jgi:phosphatidylserine/phosphatidylglycerophosphate/cardiolipin synthase-like enzyme
MRKRKESDGLTVNAIAGTHVVQLGMDLTANRRRHCLGFAIQREDHTEDERAWLRGMKTFEETDPKLGPGETVSSREHPFQDYQWADYSAKPDHDYTYRVVPLTGTPSKLREGNATSVRVQTESELGDTHSVFFNRGAIASQEYARRFWNIAPDKLEADRQAAAYRWLSRGLLEALLAFIGRATGPEHSLHAAIYEFNRAEVLLAFKAAHQRGAKVDVLYDGIPGDKKAVHANEEAIDKHKIKGICHPRRRGRLMHNKFIVLSENDQPIAVWTGSTNISENGIFGQLNVGHQVDDRTTAEAYKKYWQKLRDDDPPVEAMRPWTDQNSPQLSDLPPVGTSTLVSPRTGLKVLKAYAGMADAEKPLFMTFAFGMHQFFRDVYQRDDDVLRYALMEQEGNGASLPKAREFIRKLRRRDNVVVAVGKHAKANALDRWVQERAFGIGTFVDWVHTKFMLVDPLGQDPIVVTGSANFSEASTSDNDENMLVIRGDERVADIYLGEFQRCFRHHTFRESLTFGERTSSYLKTDPADWQRGHFDDNDDRSRRRRYFART